MKALALSVLATLALSACSTTLPLRGQVQDSGETLLGSTTRYKNGSGILEIRSSNGAICKGQFVHESERSGRGVLFCDDGRVGPFEFSATKKHGNGWGDLGSDRFVFVFGY